MSPEQARGQPVDKRTDIWAYGCVLFEMCAGHPPFAGATVGETLTEVVEREPDWERLRAGTPANIVRLLRRCLTRDPTLRLRDMEEARIPLEGARPVASGPERVTWTTGFTSWPALSSDARLLAYVSDAGQDGATPQIWIQQIRGAARRLTNGDCEYSHLAFSPDDTRVVFTATHDAGPSGYEVPAQGGVSPLLQSGVL